MPFAEHLAAGLNTSIAVGFRVTEAKSESPRGQDEGVIWDLPRTVYLYRDPSSVTLRLEEISAYLETVLGLRCEIRDEFFVHHGKEHVEGLAKRIAATRVRDILRPFQAREPMFGEVQFELRLLRDPEKRVPAILYDAFEYLALLRSLLPREEATLKTLHVAFVHRLLGTFGQDGRYHARTVVCSYPSLVSTSGLVEAPAKPEGYYKLKAKLSLALGTVPFEAAKEPFEGQFLDYDDDRMTEVAKGYALLAAMYHIAKESFCDEPSCRLFDAHTQSELLAAQVASGKLCRPHGALAERIRRSMSGDGRQV